MEALTDMVYRSVTARVYSVSMQTRSINIRPHIRATAVSDIVCVLIVVASWGTAMASAIAYVSAIASAIASP